MEYLRLIFKNKFTITGVGTMLMPIVFCFPLLFTTKASLLQINGVIQESRSYVERTEKTRRFVKEVTRVNVLDFKLKNHKQHFQLRKRLEDGAYNSDVGYSQLNEVLLAAEGVTVWIEKSDRNEEVPKIFQLDVNGKTVIDFVKVVAQPWGLYVFLFLLGAVLFVAGNMINTSART